MKYYATGVVKVNVTVYADGTVHDATIEKDSTILDMYITNVDILKEVSLKAAQETLFGLDIFKIKGTITYIFTESH